MNKVSFKERAAAKGLRTTDKSMKWLSEMEALFKSHFSDMRFHWEVCGTILEAIKKSALWKHSFTNWDDYCWGTFSCSKDKIDRLIKAAKTVNEMPKELADKIGSFSQALEISKVPEQSRESVLNHASKNGRITAEKISEESSSVTERVTDKLPPTSGSRGSVESGLKPTPPPTKAGRVPRTLEYDDIGTPITDDALPYWKRRQEVQDMLTQVSKMKVDLEKKRDSEDPMWSSACRNSIEHLKSAYFSMQEALPYAVCTQCMGHPSLQPTGCSACNNRGLISKWHWWRNSPLEIKQMRLVSNKEHADKVGRPMPDVEIHSPDSTMR